MSRWLVAVIWVVAVSPSATVADDPNPPPGNPAERGLQTLRKPLNPQVVSVKAYDNVWKVWGLKERPADFQAALADRYGLHAAPFENAGLPLGFHHAAGLFGKGVGNDCLLCHAGSVAGKTYLGLGNASLDLQGLYEDLLAAENLKLPTPFSMTNVRGTIEASNVTIFLMSFRNPDLSLRLPAKRSYTETLCEDVPAWWLMKKKKTMYHNGGGNARSVRTLMAFLLSPLNSAAYIKGQEPAFADIQAYILSLEAPKYPFAIDRKLAARGEGLFKENCARCHGTYGPDGSYPSKVVPLETVGTDPALARGLDSPSSEEFLKSWLAQEKGPDGKVLRGTTVRGYQAPPLDGVWATAPYFHNASAPTVNHVLNSKARPKVFTRSYRTRVEDYDQARMGLKVTALDGPPDPSLSPADRRKVYDTTQPGRGNGGHTFGDLLSEDERSAVIEYLKTL